ncbi:hypothetical protein [Stenotrophomonas sp. MMGLT7]|uniref:hypothetical protein n=1 Tax=Stenotrophomonas sp. MMGLT7 TaxID=2901227 RepID=UPI001E3F80B9|nr:hypothetical protein [Stenotrophomonas sp. MMGLT7]MCD7099710.1 hypothetical protein [Stenotrophomonas sp. MMGLT7]
MNWATACADAGAAGGRLPRLRRLLHHRARALLPPALRTCGLAVLETDAPVQAATVLSALPLAGGNGQLWLRLDASTAAQLAQRGLPFLDHACEAAGAGRAPRWRYARWRMLPTGETGFETVELMQRLRLCVWPRPALLLCEWTGCPGRLPRGRS